GRGRHRCRDRARPRRSPRVVRAAPGSPRARRGPHLEVGAPAAGPHGHGGRGARRVRPLHELRAQGAQGGRMSTASSHAPGVVVRARREENVAVGDEIVRHGLSARVHHWTVALLFFVCLFTGLAIWTPILGWLANLFGGLHVARWLHPWTGVALAVAALWMFLHWIGDMRLERRDREWLGPKAVAYMKEGIDTSEEGKYNGGQ